MFSLRLADSADTSVFISEAIAQWQLTEKQLLQYWGVIYFSTLDISGSLTALSQGHKVQVLLQQIENCLPELKALHKKHASVPFQYNFLNCQTCHTEGLLCFSLFHSPNIIPHSWKLRLFYTLSSQATAAWLHSVLLLSQSFYSISSNTSPATYFLPFPPFYHTISNHEASVFLPHIPASGNLGCNTSNKGFNFTWLHFTFHNPWGLFLHQSRSLGNGWASSGTRWVMGQIVKPAGLGRSRRAGASIWTVWYPGSVSSLQ